MTDPDDIATVRLLIADDDPANELLADAKIAQLLTLEGDDVKLAAASALDAIASSEVLVSKKIRSQDLSTDGPAVAAELRKHAQALREQAYEGDGSGWFEVVDFDPYPLPPELA